MPATRRTPAALSKGDRTRARIVETAIKLLSKHGYAGTSFQMIAESIGLTQSAVMHHFKDKSQLIEAVVNTAVGRNVAIVETLNRPDDDAARRLIHFCQGNLL
ncbi:MAG: TetR/AcrR family transcriptional regulator [Elusimicrobia bacterium]|nr:TetR/AcrR family transcriptional regulator [Elusimicrobiota bacterium]